MEFICFTCGTKFSKPPSQVANHSRPFCSKSCAAITNNRLHHKRTAKTCRCILCGAVVPSRRRLCDLCIDKKSVGHITLAEAIYDNQQPTNRYARIRDHAKCLYRKNPQPCQQCGYSVHTEACHKRAISSFPPETKISEINSSENIVWLCRNCHWEFDHGLLSLDN